MVNVTFTIRKQVQSWSQFAKKKKIIKKFAKSMPLSKQGHRNDKSLVKKQTKLFTKCTCYGEESFMTAMVIYLLLIFLQWKQLFAKVNKLFNNFIY